MLMVVVCCETTTVAVEMNEAPDGWGWGWCDCGMAGWVQGVLLFVGTQGARDQGLVGGIPLHALAAWAQVGEGNT